jgi:transcriptional regulator with XRE-family HTH domain
MFGGSHRAVCQHFSAVCDRMYNGVNIFDLGRKAKALRQLRGLTLEDVVTRTEFTVSWLSKLENGLLTPSLDGLVRLAEVLECGVEDLVDGLIPRPHLVVTRNGNGRRDESRSGTNGHAIEHLSEAWRGREMETTVLHLPKGRTKTVPMSNAGERFLHVLEGQMQLIYGETSEKLAVGDSAYIDARVPHMLQGDARRRSRVLSVLIRQARNDPRRKKGPGRDSAEHGLR